MFLFCCFGGGVFYFCCLGGGVGPAPTANKKKEKHAPEQQNNKHAPDPSERVYSFAVWAGGFFFFAGRVFSFFFCCLGRGVFIFPPVWAGVVFCVVLFRRGGGGCCFAVWAGDVFLLLLLFGRGTRVHSLTGLPGSSLRDPATQKTKQQKKTKKKKRVPSFNPRFLKAQPLTLNHLRTLNPT